MEPYVNAPFGKTNGEESAKTLTKREHFAVVAMQTLLADPLSDPQKTGYGDGYSEEYAASVAQASVGYADALIEALNK